MNNVALDILTRGTNQQQVFSAPLSAEKRQRKKRKNKNKNNGKDQEQEQILARCVSQAPACEALVRDFCNNDADCVATTLTCCKPLDVCNFTAFATCFTAAGV